MSYLFPKAITFILFYFAFLSNSIAQSPSFYRDSGSKYVEIKKHTTSNDFYGTAQLKVGSYLTLGNFGYSNQSWIGNNALLDYTASHDVGSLGNRNMFIPIYPNGTALVLKPDFNSGSLSGFIHHWNGNTGAVDFENFEEIWSLSEDKSFIGSSLGIGKTPASNIQLDVNGIVHAREYISVQNGSAYRVALNGQSDGYIVARNENNENTLRLSSDGNSFFNGGSVGIGTNTPSSQAKLHVNGNILASEVTVSTNASKVPDYVFKDDYKLTSLKDLENYIKENHHLPEIPSAVEVEAEGLDLAKMNLLLLKKIEELTLHTIEQSRQINSLKEENIVQKESQKSEINEMKKLIISLQTQINEINN